MKAKTLCIPLDNGGEAIVTLTQAANCPFVWALTYASKLLVFEDLDGNDERLIYLIQKDINKISDYETRN